MQFMKIAMLNLKNFSSAPGSKACVARKFLAVAKVFINSTPASILILIFMYFKCTYVSPCSKTNQY